MSNNILYSNVATLPDIPPGYFRRKSIENMLAEAISHPFVTVTAGAGYGKTQAVAAFLHDTGLPFVWLQLSGLDNLTTRFWESFVYAVASQNPYIAQHLNITDFPHSEAQFDDFIHRLADAVSEIGNVVFVFDDFHLIEEPNITRFFEHFLNARLKGLTVILISRTRVSLSIPGQLTNNLVLRITEENLRFTPEETGDYFKVRGIKMPEEAILDIHSKTEGWISAIYLIGLSLFRSNTGPENVMAVASRQIFELIDVEIFSLYAPEVQNLLIELSVLEDFSLELLKELVDIDIILEISKTNSFIYFNPVTRNYRFHNLFSEFLSEKLAYLRSGQIKNAYLKIADWYYKNDFKVDALVYYEKCGSYDKICEILSHYEIDLPQEEAALFLGMIERIPPEFVAENPIMRVIRARLLLNNGMVMEAAQELNDIRDTFSALPDTAENKAILGETYLFQALISLLAKNYDFARLYKMADECLPNGSSLIDNRLYILNGGISVTIASPEAGEIAKFEEAIIYAIPYASRVMHGCLYGSDFMTKAEAAFYAENMQKAESNAFKAIYMAQQKGQNDIVCCAYFILMRIGIASGSYEKAAGFLAEMRQKIEKPGSTDCLSMMDIFTGWFYAKLGDSEKIPDWIKSEERSASMISPNSSCNDRFVRAYYLLQTERYHELSAYIEYLGNVYDQKGFLISRLESRIVKSIAAFKTGDMDICFASLKEAYELAHANSLIMQFVEQGSDMRAVIEAMKRAGDSDIPSDWLSTILTKSKTYAKRLSVVRERHIASEGLPPDKLYNLTSREKEILNCLYQGLNRDEIAKNLFISPNTVKSALQNIYNKLGARNKADAIRITSGLRPESILGNN